MHCTAIEGRLHRSFNDVKAIRVEAESRHE